MRSRCRHPPDATERDYRWLVRSEHVVGPGREPWRRQRVARRYSTVIASAAPSATYSPGAGTTTGRLRSRPLNGVRMERLADRTPGFVTADLVALRREAALRAALRQLDVDEPRVGQADLVGALEIVRPISMSTSDTLRTGGLTLDDQVWAMADPSGQLPRDPASIDPAGAPRPLLRDMPTRSNPAASSDGCRRLAVAALRIRAPSR